MGEFRQVRRRLSAPIIKDSMMAGSQVMRIKEVRLQPNNTRPISSTDNVRQ